MAANDIFNSDSLKDEFKDSLIGDADDRYRAITSTNFKDDLKAYLFGGLGSGGYTETKVDLGKVSGYSRYFAKYGYANFAGTGPTTRYINTEGVELNKEGTDYEKQLNPYVNSFQNKVVSDKFHLTTDEYDDPTFLVYDIEIDYNNSPFFNGQLNNYFTEYKDNIPELDERRKYVTAFGIALKKYFPNIQDGKEYVNKLHYIQNISGLDILTKKIINYPEDRISITISEDINMYSQLLSELYNNIVYSYDTHRYLIPDNILRFDLKIIFNDVRMMKKSFKNLARQELDKYSTVDEDRIADSLLYKPKSVYILHDCMFDFFGSKNIGNDVSNGGWNQDVNRDPSTLTFDIVFKSVSKITVPYVKDNNWLIDLRKRDSLDYEGYQHHTLYEEQIQRQIAPPYVNTDGGLVGKFADKVKDKVLGEISDIRGTMLNKLKETTQGFADKLQKGLADSIGFSVTKFNVYIDSPANALDRVSQFAGDFVDDNFFNPLNDSLGIGEDSRDPVEYREGNVYSDYTEHQRIEPNGDLHDDGSYNQKFPTKESLHDDGTYHDKKPDGDLHEDGTYHDKKPDGDLHDDGTYNEKYPDGDLHEDGVYNEKYPDGDLHEDGTYHDKKPDGDLHKDGVYNEKYPDGDLHENGSYHNKQPDGNRYTNPETEVKQPNGDLHDDGTYNEKYPDGQRYINPENEVKNPDGDLHEDGTYHDKQPNGTRFINPENKDKLPDGDLHEDGKYNEKYPDGTLFNNLDTQIKEPSGGVFEDGKYNEKYPEGKVSDDPQLKINFPEGNVYGNTKNNLPKNPNGNRYKK